MDKLYIVFKDSGSWDSHWNNVDKVFDSKKKAEEYADKITKEMKTKQALIPKDPTEDDDFKGDWEVTYDKHNEDMKIFREQYPDYYDWYEFNECTVVEFEIN